MAGLYAYTYIQYRYTGGPLLIVTLLYLLMAITGMIAFAVFITGWMQRGRDKRSASGISGVELDSADNRV